MTTSDRFLDNYARSFISDGCDADCYNREIPSLLGSQTAQLQQLANADLRAEIAALEGNYRIARNNAMEAFTQRDLTWEKDGALKSFDRYWKLESKIRLSANARFLEDLKKNPEQLALIRTKDKLYRNLVACQRSGKTDVTQCADYPAYAQVDGKIQILQTTFFNNHRVTELSEKNSVKSAYHQHTITALLGVILQLENKTMAYEAREEKLKLFFRKKYALFKMLKENDTRAIKLWRALKRCETVQL